MKTRKSMKEDERQKLEEQLGKYPLSKFEKDLSRTSLAGLTDNFHASEIVLATGERDYIYISKRVGGIIGVIADLYENQTQDLGNFSARMFERSEFYPLAEKGIITAGPMNLGKGRTVKLDESICYLASPGPLYEQTKVVALGIDFKEGFKYCIL